LDFAERPARIASLGRRIATRLPVEGDARRLLHGAGIAFSIQVLGAGASFVLQVLMGRWLGPAGYGTFVFTISWASLVAVGCCLGLPTMLLRFVAAYIAEGDDARLHGVMRMSFAVTAASGLGVAVLGSVGFAALRVAGVGVDPAVLIGFWLVPVLALMRLQQEAIRSFRRLALAYAPGLLWRPVAVIAVAATLVGLGFDLTAPAALLIALASLACVIAVQLVRFAGYVRTSVAPAEPVYEARMWMRVALPLLLIASFMIVLSETDIVMVGALVGSRQAGLYAAASKTASLVAFVLIAVNAIAAPMISAQHARGEHAEMQRLAARVARWTFFPSLAICLFLAVLAEPVLELFGSEFGAARWELVILLGGQLVNAMAGSVGFLMILTGYQREAAWVYGWVAVAHVAMNVTGILLFGAIGAAIATALSFALWNVWLYVLVVKRLDIHSSIFTR
jgi:O-antigen/teichoic acid export membrane protein